MKFLTNILKHNLLLLRVIKIKLFGYTIKIYGKPTFKNIVKSCKRFAKKLGYKNPIIYIYDNATSLDNKKVSDVCWAIYVKENEKNNRYYRRLLKLVSRPKKR